MIIIIYFNMGATLWTLEKDLWDKSIPLFERPWMNTDTEWWRELMSRIRAKRATLVSRAMEDPKALQESHPWEYRQFREDLWIYKDDFDGYTTLFVPRIIEGLKSLRISSWEEFLDRNQWIPYLLQQNLIVHLQFGEVIQTRLKNSIYFYMNFKKHGENQRRWNMIKSGRN